MPEANLQIQQIDVARLMPNPWNPNRMPAGTMEKLRGYLKREGFVEPLVVRPHGEGTFEILGGFHRWLAAKDLGYRTVPCITVDVDDRRARILTVNLNELRGETVPALMAKLIHELEASVSLEDLSAQLPYTVPDLEDLSRLLQVPDGLTESLTAAATKAEADRIRVLSFAVTPEQEAAIEQALAAVLEREPGVTRGHALASIVQRSS